MGDGGPESGRGQQKVVVASSRDARNTAHPHPHLLYPPTTQLLSALLPIPFPLRLRGRETTPPSAHLSGGHGSVPQYRCLPACHSPRLLLMHTGAFPVLAFLFLIAARHGGLCPAACLHAQDSLTLLLLLFFVTDYSIHKPSHRAIFSFLSFWRSPPAIHAASLRIDPPSPQLTCFFPNGLNPLPCPFLS